MNIRITNGVQERFSLALQKDPLTIGWLFGWHLNEGIVCIGCASASGNAVLDLVHDLTKTAQLIPAGLDVVGFFMLGNEAANRSGVLEFFEQLITSGLQGLNETSEFCFLAQGSGDKRCIGYLYNSTEHNASQANVITEEASVLLKKTELIRLKGSLLHSYELSNGVNIVKDNIEEAFGKLCELVKSPVATFHLKNSQVLFTNQGKFNASVPGLREDTPCSDLRKFIMVDNDGFGGTGDKKKKNKENVEQEPLKFKLTFLTTNSPAIKRSIPCLPIVYYELRDFKNVSSYIPVDIMAVIPKNFSVGKLNEVLTEGVLKQLDAIKKCVLGLGKNATTEAEVFHFRPFQCDHMVTVVYPKDVSDADLEPYRQKMHKWLMLPDTRPVLRRANRYLFTEDRLTGGYLLNTHIGLPPSGVTGGKQSIVHGTYAYHHYMQDRFDDNGWGCAYRSLQTIISWFRHQGYTNAPVPTHEQIQKALVEVGDKPSSFVGSKKWIGSLEVSYCLEQLIGVECKIMNVSAGADLANKGRELANHFQVQGTPIMIGGGVLAHTIIGVDFNEVTGDVKFLILDPHYTGGEDLHIIQSKGWCGWKGMNFWDANAYYNLCLPLRPMGI